jgi:hypothetical protein
MNLVRNPNGVLPRAHIIGGFRHRGGVIGVVRTLGEGAPPAAEFQAGCRAGLVKPPQPTEPREKAQSSSDPLTPLEPSIWGY